MVWRLFGTRCERETRLHRCRREKQAAADPRVRAVMRLRNYVIRGWSARQYVRVNVIIKESITYSGPRSGIPNFSLPPIHPPHFSRSSLSNSPSLCLSRLGFVRRKVFRDWMPDAIKLQRRTRDGKWPEMRKGLTFSSVIRKVTAARSCYVRSVIGYDMPKTPRLFALKRSFVFLHSFRVTSV